jgi:hypothetical protein
VDHSPTQPSPDAGDPLPPAAPPFAWLGDVPLLLLTAAAALVSVRLAGTAHGVAFAGCLIAWLAASAACATTHWRDAALAAAFVGVGSACGSLYAWLSGASPMGLASGQMLLALACASAAGGLAHALAALRLSPPIAATIVVVLGLLWLGWPIWASPYLPGREDLVSALSWAHPLLSADAAIVRDGGIPWSEHRLMYNRLTVLQQHVFPRPPTSIAPAILVHLAIGLTAFTLGRLVSRRSTIPRQTAEHARATPTAAEQERSAV